ncbi:helix-turn-helix domain-containing protein [Streptomyces lichenis]|uniref:Helix-turn-helix domain-containing protein n=1 Tax=Streptomyces lichenis TaxID=2306967 RepID=A0ABT0I934_9ACTN|nr:helix-turn-helix transcriptional regulator [Streptomyces lichenis]MCK8677842.1 helix-turn-helix domain-containing protein [Streptomyces lichenis]
MPTKRQLPTARLRRLAREMRRLRSEAGLTREEIAASTAINQATLYRLEYAKGRPQKRTLLTLLKEYGVEESQREAILALSSQADEQGWLRPYHADLPDELVGYISFESEARSVRNYEASCVPGLLQTEDYAQAVVRGILPNVTAGELDRLVRARIDRRAVFESDEPLELWAIIDEAVLRRGVGGTEVMVEQLNYLTKLAAEPYVTLQVIPFSVGAHPGMPGGFVVMDFPDAEDHSLVYMETMTGDLFLETDEDVRRCSQTFDHLRAQALSPDDSTRLIASVVREYVRGRQQG